MPAKTDRVIFTPAPVTESDVQLEIDGQASYLAAGGTPRKLRLDFVLETYVTESDLEGVVSDAINEFISDAVSNAYSEAYDAMGEYFE